jgi:hypothetical protein
MAEMASNGRQRGGDAESARMAVVSKVRCPGCQNELRIPTEWLARKIRCKQCGRSFAAADEARAASLITNPAPAEPAPEDVFRFDTVADDDGELELVAVPSTTRRQQAGWSTARWAALATAAAVILIAVIGAAFIVKSRSGPGDESNVVAAKLTDYGPTQTTLPAKAPATPVDLPKAGSNFPRRFLAVCVHNYLYANPVSPRGDRTGMADVLRTFAKERLRISPDQIYVLSDAAPGKEARAPVRPVIEQTIERFLTTCRPQDRAMLVFVGHAVDVDDQPYLVPLEGELSVKETLIPLKWLYDKLATCPARQKLLVMDLCRGDTARGNERPGSGPMGPKLDAALANPPAGVQVLSACVAGQFSHEYDFAMVGNFDVKGGAFLNLLTQSARSGWGLPKPEESLPVALLADRVKEPLTQLVASRDKVQQTVRLSGAEPTEVGEGAAYTAAEPMPPRFDLPKAAALTEGGLADPQVIRSILGEIDLPPMKPPRDAEKAGPAEDEALKLASIVPFRAEAIKGYEADYANPREIIDKADKYPVRIAVIHAVEALDKLAKSGKGKLMEEFRGQATDDVKKSITESQKDGPARLGLELEDALTELQKVADRRSEEKSKRWLAHYDYVLAQVKGRLAYVHEYNLMLGKAKRDELPPLDPKVHNGWRLASQEKVQSPKEVKDLASEAKKLLNKVIQENPGTPWEVLAKRDRFIALGLAWQPANFGQ